MKPMKRSRAGLTRSAAALGLMLAAVAAAPACAEEAAGKASANDASKAQAATPASQASTDQKKDESNGTAKAANPCAVSKKKKKSPCAIGG